MSYHALYDNDALRPTTPFNSARAIGFDRWNQTNDTQTEDAHDILALEAGQTESHQRVLNLIEQGQPAKAIDLLQDLELSALASPSQNNDEFYSLLTEISTTLSPEESDALSLGDRSILENMVNYWLQMHPTPPEAIIASESKSRDEYEQHEENRLILAAPKPPGI